MAAAVSKVAEVPQALASLLPEVLECAAISLQVSGFDGGQGGGMGDAGMFHHQHQPFRWNIPACQGAGEI